MKPFDLEAAKAGAPVITRNGEPARIICFDKKAEIFPIVALVLRGVEEEEITYTTNGRFERFNESRHDLFMATVEKTGWINVYASVYNKVARVPSGKIYSTWQEAIDGTRNDCLATIEITWEE